MTLALRNEQNKIEETQERHNKIRLGGVLISLAFPAVYNILLAVWWHDVFYKNDGKIEDNYEDGIKDTYFTLVLITGIFLFSQTAVMANAMIYLKDALKNFESMAASDRVMCYHVSTYVLVILAFFAYVI